MTAVTFERNESGRFGALKSDSTHHFFRNACTKSGSLRFSQFSGCWLILSVYILNEFWLSLCKIVRSSVMLLLPLLINTSGTTIQCEDCFFWHHINCINMTVKEYNDLSNSWESWFCRSCILPSLTNSFFDMSLNENNNEKTADTSLRSSDTEFSNTGSSKM